MQQEKGLSSFCVSEERDSALPEIEIQHHLMCHTVCSAYVHLVIIDTHVSWLKYLRISVFYSRIKTE